MAYHIQRNKQVSNTITDYHIWVRGLQAFSKIFCVLAFHLPPKYWNLIMSSNSNVHTVSKWKPYYPRSYYNQRLSESKWTIGYKYLLIKSYEKGYLLFFKSLLKLIFWKFIFTGIFHHIFPKTIVHHVNPIKNRTALFNWLLKN